MKNAELKNRQFILLLFLLTSITLQAGSNYYFKQISTEQGLTQTMVRCISNDHNGLIWIGTKAGLNSFDQHELKTYFHEKDKEHSLPNNQINYIFEDSLLNLWIGTEKGTAIYDRGKDIFTPVMFQQKPFLSFSAYHTTEGVLFGGAGVIYLYRYSTRKLEKLPLQDKQKLTCQFNKISQWSKEVLFIGSRYEGAFLYHVKTQEITPLSFFPEKDVTSIYIDSKHQLWVSPYSKGLYCYNQQGTKLFHFTKENSGLNNNIILDITEKDNQLWLATDGGGINILDLTHQSFSAIEHLTGDVYSLPVNSIYCLYNDLENNLWAGSIRGGLLGIKEVFIRTYKDVPLNNIYGLSDKSVISLHKEPNGYLWIGTDGGGVNSFNPQTGKFVHYPSTYSEKVVSITDYSEQELLISLFSKGIFRFNKRTHTLTPLLIVNERINNEQCISGTSVYLEKISDDQILFLGKDTYLYEIKNNRFNPVNASDPYFQNLLQRVESNDSISYLMGQFHIATLNHRTHQLDVLFSIDKSSSLVTACLDKKERIWIGTDSGLAYYDLKRKKIFQIETSLFNNVSSLNYDEQGRLWIGAQNLLFCYIIDENRFIILGESDGVYPNELLHLPALKSNNKYIYMGGTSGLVCIDKNITFESDSQTEVKLMDVIVNGISKIGSLETNQLNKIEIPWNHTSLVIKLMAKEKDLFRKKMFRYSIVGLDKQYIESYNHILNMRSLPPGDYIVMASCSTQSGIWSPPVEILAIQVIPPWWKSAWFILCCIVAAVIGIILAGLVIIRKNKNKLKWEMKEYEKKTYEEKIRFLINISHELRTPLTLIYAPLKRLLNGQIENEELNKQLTGVYKQARQMKNIINMVLDVRKMEVGQDTLHILSHPMNEWLCSVADDFKNEFNSKNIELIYNFDESLEEVSFDKGKCEIVLSNLLMNALKFSQPNTQVILSTKVLENGKRMRLSVIDQGIGLSGVDTNKLFTRFYQGNHDRSGSGIGLSYAKMLIEMHRGKIGAQHNPDGGATFYFELPIGTMPEKITCEAKPYLNELLYSPHQEELKTELFPTNNYTLLLVEDEPELRTFLKDSLHESFKSIFTAPNGAEALETINQYHPDMVVSDVMMPVMDGFELCKKIKENVEISHIPIILLTARNDAESTTLGYKTGADAYLSKPFEMDFLMTLIRNQLKNREQIKLKYKNSGLSISAEEATFSNADEKFLLKLNTLIYENLSNQNLDVKFLTEQIAMSRASLYNKLKALTDMGVNDYINKIRIEKAALLLTETELSITEISEQTGFAYQRYFSSVFKQEKGATPSKFRQERVQKPKEY